MRKLLLFIIAGFCAAEAIAQIPNADFESWTSQGSYEDPDGWLTLNEFSAFGLPVSTTKDTNEYSGSYAMRLETVSSFFGPVAGLAVTGSGNTTGFPYNKKPLQLKGYYKFAPVSGDTAMVSASLTRWNTDSMARVEVASAVLLFTSAASSYTQFLADFVYLSADAPDTLSIRFVSSGGEIPVAGTVLVVDSISLVGVDDASFAYGSSVYCQSAANPTPTVTGEAGGIFTATAGLVIDSVTGTIDLTTSPVGIYTITYTTTDPYKNSDSVSVGIVNAFDATFSYSDSSYCSNYSDPDPLYPSGAFAGTFTATPAGIVLDSATGTIDLSASAPGTYMVINTIAASGSCPAASDSQMVTIIGQPAEPVAGGTTICAFESATLVAIAPGGAYNWYDFFWAFLAAGDTFVTAELTSPSIFYVNTTINGCTSPNTYVFVMVDSLPPEPVISKDVSVLTSSAATGNQWYKNDVAIAGATSDTYTVTENADYRIVVTGDNGCTISSATVTINDVSIKENGTGYQAKIYPNPGSGVINILHGNTDEAAEISISDVSGKCVYFGRLAPGAAPASVDVSYLVEGIYFLQLTFSQNISNHKIIITK